MTVKAFNPDSPLNERRMVIRRSGEDVETVDLPWGLQPREPGARRAVGSSLRSIPRSTALTELAVTLWHCIEYPDLETPCGALARGDDGSGETSLRGANFLHNLAQLIRIRDSERLIRDRRAHQRAIQSVIGPSGCKRALISRVSGWRVCAEQR